MLTPISIEAWNRDSHRCTHLQLAMLAATAAARRGIARRRHAIAEAELTSGAAGRALRAQLEDERRLAAASLHAGFDEDWWETASPQEVASMGGAGCRLARDDPSVQEPTIFDEAAGQIEHEARHRSGLNIVELLALAELQRLEHDDHAASEDHDQHRRATAGREPSVGDAAGEENLDPARSPPAL